MSAIAIAVRYTILFWPLLVTNCYHRYSAVRRQFGTEGGSEMPIIEYPLHVICSLLFHFGCGYVLCWCLQQWRLFPYLAAVCVLEHFSGKLFCDFVDFKVAQIFGGDMKDRTVSYLLL